MIDWIGKCAFSSLFLRLSWPDPMVRLVAAKSISKRLSEDPDRLLPIFLKWIETRTLEIDIVNSIAILKLSGMCKRLEYSDLKKILHAESVLSHDLLSGLFEDSIDDFNWTDNHSSFFDEDFSNDKHFNLVWKRQTFWGLHAIKKLAKDNGFPFKEQFAFEWKKIIDKGYPSSFSDSYFRTYTIEKYKAFLTPLMLDVSLSAFLRTLSLAIQYWGMPVDFATYLARGLYPFYLDIPETKNGEVPKGWASSNDDIKSSLEIILHKNPSIVYLSGPWTWSNERHPIIDVSVKAVIVKSDTQLNETEELWNSAKLNFIDQVKDEKPVLGKQVSNDIYEILNKEINAKCANCIPIVVNYHPSSQPLWTLQQIFRGYFIPLSVIENKSLELVSSEYGTEYLVGETNVGRQEYWLYNWAPSFIIDSSPRLGTTVYLDLTYLQENLVTDGQEIRYLYRIISASSEMGYGELEETIEYGFLDL